ncbi:MAG TPA: hypothetical protein VGL61_33125 [Kofleriaceae bacterium]|jgi:hypothetical protein
MKAISEETEFLELDELALSLINGGDFNPDKTPSGENGPDGKPMSCTQVFAQGHCSQACVGALLQDWKRLKGQQPPATPAPKK